MVLNTALFNQCISHKLYTWCILEILVPFDDAMGEMGALDDAMINWDPTHHFDEMMRKLPLIAQWNVLAPLIVF